MKKIVTIFIGRNHSSIITTVLAVTILLFLGLTPVSATGCDCLGGIDNFCLYPPSTADCSMTYPGGYCDPNGDGNFADADWVKGYYEYQAACPDGGTNPPPPPPSGGNDYSDWIYGIHWYGDNYAGTDVEAMTGGKGIWVMETVTIWDGWTVGDQLQKFNTIVDRGHTLILRIQPRWGWSIPAPGAERQQYLDAVEAAAQQAKNVSHIWQIGNEMNLYGEYGGGVLTAQEYIDYFKQIRQRIKNVSSPLGPQVVLVGPVSPGAYAGEVRHTDGLQYLGQMCALLNANDFDGFALHAYGAPWLDANGARWDFQNGSGGYAAQLGVIDNHGFRDKPAFILEWNRQTPNEEAGQEAQTAQFIIGAYQDLQTWNNNPNNHPVVCATWFIYADVNPWEIFSLRGLRDKNPRGVNQDVWDSFQHACSLNIPAGDLGSGPNPPPPPPPNPGTPPGDNLALEASDWSASSVYNANFGGDKATDGVIDAGSKWTSDGSSAASWLALDLGSNCDLTGFIVRHAGAAGEPAAYNTQSYRLESGTSLSGPWTTLATVDNAGQQNSSTTILANNKTAGYVRLYIIDAGIDNYARIPEFEVYGSAGSPPPPPPPTGGPLVNGGFEGDVQGDGVGQGWSSFSSTGYGANYAVVSDQVQSGSYAQQVLSPQPSTNDQYAGVYQVFGTESGNRYTVRAWNQTHFSGGSAWDHIARLGIDLTGGTDFQGGAVAWYEFDSAKDTWHLLEKSVTATGSSMTIFLGSWRKWASGGDAYTWFDDVEVVADDQPPVPGNNPPTAAATANPASGQAPLTVSFDATGSSDPDGDSLSFSWDFGDGSQGSGAIVSHTYQTRGIYSAILTVDDGRGGSDDVTATIAVSTTGPPLPSYCPSTLDFAAIRAQLNQQGDDLAFVKIGFHVGPGGNQNGLGEWMTCLDAAGVPFFLKSVDSAGQIWEAAQLKAASGVPHVLVYRRSAGSGWNWDVPDYNKTPFDAAVEHWQRQRQEFPPELEPYKDLIWIETINEVDKNRSEWLGEFAYHTAQMAMDEGFNWAAFGWSSGEPEREDWEGPWMQQFLELAGNNPDRIAVALHEYSYVRDNLDRLYPNLVGRFQMLFDVCDTAGIARPKVLVTEFGWVYDDIANSVQQAMEVDLPWAAGLYADFPQVLGASIWYLGPGFGGIANQAQQLIAPVTEYALQEYFVVPLESAPPPPTGPESITGGEPKGSFGSGGQTDEVSEPETWRWSERFYGHQGIDQITWQADACGVQHNYAIGWHRNDLVEYLMKFGGNYSRLTLRGLADRPGPVKLEIYIDGNYAAAAVWDNDNDCNQDAAVEIGGIPYGTHAIAVKFVNDYYDPAVGADRNFYLDGLRVAP